jgi:predicted ATPase/class 3 adenylate cyclase
LVTFLFTDVAGSTRLQQRLQDAYAPLLRAHFELLFKAVHAAGGVVVKTLGDGVFAAFSDPAAGTLAARDAQLALSRHSWPDGARFTVRMGLHCGLAEPVDDDYIALAVNQAARISAAAHGGQVIASSDVVEAAGDAGARWNPIGAFTLKDFDEPVRLSQLVDPQLPSGFPALRAMPAAAHNVPMIASPFVGRGAELQRLRDLLAEYRLVSLVGPGGSGKTRLAFECARTTVGSFPDGTWVALLANLDDPAGVPFRLAAALSVTEERGRPLVDTLVDRLRSKRLLLVVDNCEHVIDSVAPLLADLMAGAPGLSVLTTSQEPLHIGAEHVWRIPPLQLPAAGARLRADEIDQLASDALGLFVARARAARPGLRLVDSDVEHVVQICRALDGMPLAIELAAARLRHLTPADLAARLGRALPVLSGGPRDAPARQRTLRATIEWSYGLLGEQEQRLFRRLSVFRGSFSLERAEVVCADDDLPADDVWQLLGSLVDRSVVASDDSESKPSYRMLATLREFAGEQLAESDERAELLLRHARHFAAVGEEAAQRRGPLAAGDVDDVEAALEWVLQNGDPALVFPLVNAYSSHCFSTSRFRAARPYCVRTLDAVDVKGVERLRVLYLAGLLAVCEGDTVAARRYGSRLLDEAPEEARGPRAGAHHILGDVAMWEGNAAEAADQYRTARELTDVPRTKAILTRSLGDAAGLAGDRTEHLRLQRRALDEIRTNAPDPFEEGRTLIGLAWLLASGGPDEVREAETILRRAVTDAEKLGYPGLAAESLFGFAHVALNRHLSGLAAAFAQRATEFANEHDISLLALDDGNRRMTKLLEAVAALPRPRQADFRAVHAVLDEPLG